MKTPHIMALLPAVMAAVLSARADAPDGDAQDWLRRGVAAEVKDLGRIMRRMIESYDLDQRTKAATKNIAADKEFAAFLKKKGIDPDNLTKTQEDNLLATMMEYGRTTQKLPDEAIAWWSLMAIGMGAPWRASISDYRALEKKRPDDLPPKLLMLSRTLTNAVDCEEWLAMLKSAHASATSDEQRACCFMVAIHSTVLNLGTNEFAGQTLSQLKRWVSELRKSETAPPVQQKMDSLRMVLAFSQGNLSEAADLTQDTPLRSWRPIYYLVSKKPERAREALAELRALTNLSTDEKNTIDAAERALNKTGDPKPATPVK